MKKLFATIMLTVLIIVIFVFTDKLPYPKELLIQGGTSSLSKDIFSPEQLKWIETNQNRIFNVGVSNTYAPIEYINGDGQPTGIGIEIIKEVNALTGLKFKLYSKNHSEDWGEKLQSAQNGRIDTLPSVSYTIDRHRFLHFSNSYMEMTQIIVGHSNKYKLIDTFNDIKEDTFAVPKGYWFEYTILRENPEAKIIYVKNMEEALKYVDNKKADYTICEIPVFTFYKEEYKNIKIVGELAEKNKIYVGVRKEFGTLVTIFDSVIANMDYDEIFERALATSRNNEREKKLLYLSGVLLLVLLIVVYLLVRTYSRLLKAKRAAEEANRDKSKLMANISHDLRTPITVAMGYMEAIIDGEVRKAEDKEKYIRITYQKLKYLSELIDDFFLLARLEDSRLKLNIEQTDINAFLKSIVEHMEPRARSKNLSITVNIDEAAHIIKEIDRLKVNRAVENIITNAINYSKDQGKIEIGAILSDDGEIKIVIRDYGIGIQPEDLPHLFERYYKGKNSNQESIGLGLYIAKEIIDKHNGQIWAESELGQGSTFYIVL